MSLKQRADRIIELLSNKELSRGCVIASSNIQNELIDIPDKIINQLYWESIPADREIIIDEEFYLWGRDFVWNCEDDDSFEIECLKAPWDYECESVNIKDFKIIGHPVLIGDVLQKLPKGNAVRFTCIDTTHVLLLNAWRRYGFAKSLNEILSGASNGEEMTNAVKLLEFLEDVFKDQLK